MPVKTQVLKTFQTVFLGCLGLLDLAPLWVLVEEQASGAGGEVQEVPGDQDGAGELGQAGGAVQPPECHRHSER